MTANNLANAETTAFKRSRTNFEDLMYQVLKQPGAVNGAGDRTPRRRTQSVRASLRPVSAASHLVRK